MNEQHPPGAGYSGGSAAQKTSPAMRQITGRLADIAQELRDVADRCGSLPDLRHAMNDQASEIDAAIWQMQIAEGGDSPDAEQVIRSQSCQLAIGETLWDFSVRAEKISEAGKGFRVEVLGNRSRSVTIREGHNPLWELIRILGYKGANVAGKSAERSAQSLQTGEAGQGEA